MRRLVGLVTLAFVVSLVLAPSAVAQYVEEEMKGEPPLEEKMEPPAEEKAEEAMEPVPDPPYAQEKQMEKAKAKAEKAKAEELPKTGGPSASVILPAAALLLVGSGVLAYTVVRRR
jgi:LPXTG-motif cell wall-anchored protein